MRVRKVKDGEREKEKKKRILLVSIYSYQDKKTKHLFIL